MRSTQNVNLWGAALSRSAVRETGLSFANVGYGGFRASSTNYLASH